MANFGDYGSAILPAKVDEVERVDEVKHLAGFKPYASMNFPSTHCEQGPHGEAEMSLSCFL